MEIPSKRIMVDGQLETNPAYLRWRTQQMATERAAAEARRPVIRVKREPKPLTDEETLRTDAERLRMWRELNPDKVRAATARASARRAAKLAVPDGTACDVCGTLSNVQRDTKRNGVLCRECKPAVGIVWAVQRSAQYREAIEQYIMRDMLA
jgi:hypothetical protein